MNIVGIDPGLKGGIAFLYPQGHMELYNMPTRIEKAGKKKRTFIDESELLEILVPRVNDINLVIIEKAQAMPKQGVVSMFNYGMGYGILRGICSALELPYELVRPQTWKARILTDTKRDKAAAIEWTERQSAIVNGKKLTDGMADAACIAQWGLETQI